MSPLIHLIPYSFKPGIIDSSRIKPLFTINPLIPKLIRLISVIQTHHWSKEPVIDPSTMLIPLNPLICKLVRLIPVDVDSIRPKLINQTDHRLVNLLILPNPS